MPLASATDSHKVCNKHTHTHTQHCARACVEVEGQPPYPPTETNHPLCPLSAYDETFNVRLLLSNISLLDHTQLWKLVQKSYQQIKVR